MTARGALAGWAAGLAGSTVVLALAACAAPAPAPDRSSSSSSPAFSPAFSTTSGSASRSMSGSVSGSTPDSAPTSTGGWWRPTPGASFDYLLGVPSGTRSTADIVVLDGEEAAARDVAVVHERGAHALCYVNAGAWEPYRFDATRFPQRLRGAAMEGWPDERWLDIREREALLGLMKPRVAACAEKGFDGVDFDNVHAYTQETGFPLTAAHQRSYNLALAGLAHSHGLAAALKNDLEQIPDLMGAFDLAVNEECLAYDECEAYAPFVKAGKPVLNIEYENDPDRCERAERLGITSIRKRVELDSWVEAC